MQSRSSILFFVLLMVWIGAGPASAMEIRIVQTGLPVQVELRGEAHSGDAARIIGLLEKARPRDLMAEIQAKAGGSLYDSRQWLWLDVESSGGDLDEMLTIGRYLRSANALITTKEICTSACVFLLAGAVERVGLAASEGRVGVHRPYPADSRGGSSADFERLFDALQGKIADYLKQMRLPPVLADLMFAIPPEEMHMLSPEELEFLLPERDAAWDGSTTARRAAIYGIPSAAYRRLELSARQECEREDQPASVLPVADCVPAQSPGVSLDEFEARKLLFEGRCASAPGTYQMIRAGNSDFTSCVAGFAGHSAAITRRDGGAVVLILKLASQDIAKRAGLRVREGAQNAPRQVDANQLRPAARLADPE
jgi:hypothetical protein